MAGARAFLTAYNSRILAGVVPARRRIFALVLVSVLVVLVPLADATPPDPTWPGASTTPGISMTSFELSSAVVNSLPCRKSADLMAGNAWPTDVVPFVAATSCTFIIRAPPFTARIAIA